MTALEGDLVIAMASALMTVVGWVAVRQEMWGRKVVRLEMRLENGISAELKAITRSLKDHMDGEEHRIMDALAGQGRKKRK